MGNANRLMPNNQALITHQSTHLPHLIATPMVHELSSSSGSALVAACQLHLKERCQLKGHRICQRIVQNCRLKHHLSTSPVAYSLGLFSGHVTLCIFWDDPRTLAQPNTWWVCQSAHRFTRAHSSRAQPRR
jgi:hypothetical protein